MSTQGARASQRRLTVRDIRARKAAGDPIAALTAYDCLFARLVDEAGVDLVLVGDSLGNVVLGLPSTIGVTLDHMIHHARAVRRGVDRALLVVDMPFLTYQVSDEEALRNAGRIMAESGAEAVKLEGGSERIAAVARRLVEAGIPVVGHLGFTPQSVHAMGGYRVQGRDAGDQDELVVAARRLEDAGAFAIVLELIPGATAQRITEAVGIPTIGIGAGPGCDGQILVLQDMLGMNPDFHPKYLRCFAEIGEAAGAGVRSYVEAVRNGSYPESRHTFE